jgi:hypothetical protein
MAASGLDDTTFFDRSLTILLLWGQAAIEIFKAQISAQFSMVFNGNVHGSDAIKI